MAVELISHILVSHLWISLITMYCHVDNYFQDKVCLCSPSTPRVRSVDQAGLKDTDPYCLSLLSTGIKDILHQHQATMVLFWEKRQELFFNSKLVFFFKGTFNSQLSGYRTISEDHCMYLPGKSCVLWSFKKNLFLAMCLYVGMHIRMWVPKVDTRNWNWAFQKSNVRANHWAFSSLCFFYRVLALVKILHPPPLHKCAPPHLT